jgi:Skp family chaperone for outer membrane proteins
MGGIAFSSVPRPTPFWTRRKAIALAILPLGMGPLGLGLPVGQARAADQVAILMVSRKRLLNDTAHARALLKAEIELNAELQRRVDAVKAELTAEEQELTRLRPSLEREEFDARVAEFDRNVRRQRRETQQRAAILQNAFRKERLKLVESLGPILEEVREAHGASVILNADQALSSDPALDVTDEVIVRFEATVAPPLIPDLDALPPPDTGSGQGNQSAPQ